jgi:hypothetical protein
VSLGVGGNIETDTFELGFDAEATQFSSLARDERLQDRFLEIRPTGARTGR